MIPLACRASLAKSVASRMRGFGGTGLVGKGNGMIAFDAGLNPLSAVRPLAFRRHLLSRLAFSLCFVATAATEAPAFKDSSATKANPAN